MIGVFQVLVLLAIQLLRENAYGQEIAKTIGSFTTEPHVEQVYMALSRLKAAGLVRVIPSPQTGLKGRPRVVYECTQEGGIAVENYVNILNRMQHAIEHLKPHE